MVSASLQRERTGELPGDGARVRPGRDLAARGFLNAFDAATGLPGRRWLVLDGATSAVGTSASNAVALGNHTVDVATGYRPPLG